MHFAKASKFCCTDEFLWDVSGFWWMPFFPPFFFLMSPAIRPWYRNCSLNPAFSWLCPLMGRGRNSYTEIKRRACITTKCCASHPFSVQSEVSYLWKMWSGNMNRISKETWPTFSIIFFYSFTLSDFDRKSTEKYFCPMPD